MGYGGSRPMPWVEGGGFGQSQDLAADRVGKGFRIAPPQVRPPNTTLKDGISYKGAGVVWEVKEDVPWRMAWHRPYCAGGV